MQLLRFHIKPPSEIDWMEVYFGNDYYYHLHLSFLNRNYLYGREYLLLNTGHQPNKTLYRNTKRPTQYSRSFYLPVLEASKLVNPIQINSEELPSATAWSPAVSCNGCAADECREIPEAVPSGSPNKRIPEQTSSNCARVYCEKLCLITTRIGWCVVRRRGRRCLLGDLAVLPWESASRKSWSALPWESSTWEPRSAGPRKPATRESWSARSHRKSAAWESWSALTRRKPTTRESASWKSWRSKLLLSCVTSIIHVGIRHSHACHIVIHSIALHSCAGHPSVHPVTLHSLSLPCISFWQLRVPLFIVEIIRHHVSPFKRFLLSYVREIELGWTLGYGKLFLLHHHTKTTAHYYRTNFRKNHQNPFGIVYDEK